MKNGLDASDALLILPLQDNHQVDEVNGYRIRVRELRILYRVDDHGKEVIVYRVKHGREVYRR